MMRTIGEGPMWGTVQYETLLREDGAYLHAKPRGRYAEAMLTCLDRGVTGGGPLQLAGRLGAGANDPLGAVVELALEHAKHEALALGPAGGPLGVRLALVWPGVVSGIVGMAKDLQRRGAYRPEWPSVREVRQALTW